MTPKNLLLFLLGNREAIRELAADRRTLWLGLLFVFSAALAREYDGEYLLAEPWHLLIPFAASLVASFAVYAVAYAAGKWQADKQPAFFACYRRFLALFWLTAPLAWAYAIPYERFLEVGPAVEANLYSLLVVAAWRVVLAARVLGVLFGSSTSSMLYPVLFLSDTLVLTVLNYVPLPLISIMGGVRLSPADAALARVASLVACTGFLTWPVWAFGALRTLVRARKEPWPGAEFPPPSPGKPALAFGLAGVSLVAFAAALPFTQPEQALRYELEHAYRTGQHATAVELLSTRPWGDFPPHYDPPPRLKKNERRYPSNRHANTWHPNPDESVLEFYEALAEAQLADPVRELYVAKLQAWLQRYKLDTTWSDLPRQNRFHRMLLHFPGAFDYPFSYDLQNDLDALSRDLDPEPIKQLRLLIPELPK